MNRVNAFTAEEHIPYLLDLAHRRMQQDLEQLADSKRFPDLRGSHFRLLSMIPAQGARPSALADIAKVTRPALGELVRHLEDCGYVSTQADPADGRAVIVQLTRRGKQASAAVDKAVNDLKRSWAREIGADKVAALIDACAALTLGQRAQS